MLVGPSLFLPRNVFQGQGLHPGGPGAGLVVRLGSPSSGGMVADGDQGPRVQGLDLCLRKTSDFTLSGSPNPPLLSSQHLWSCQFLLPSIPAAILIPNGICSL